MYLPRPGALAAFLCAAFLSGCASSAPVVEARAPTAPPPMSPDEVELRERALPLCQQHQFGAPAPSRLPEGARAELLIRDADLAFVRDWPDVARRTPVDVPGAFAVVSPHIRCEVESVRLRECTAAVTVRQTRPRWEDPSFPAEALKAATTSADRRALMAAWLATAPEPVTETQRLTFSRTPSGWRADYELPERMRGLEDPFFAPLGAGPVLPPYTPATGPKVDESKATAPRVFCQRPVEYTEKAVHARIEGQSLIKCVLTPEGSIKRCRVLKSVPFMDQAVLDNLYDTRFKPATYEGRPVQIDYTFTLNFQLPR